MRQGSESKQPQEEKEREHAVSGALLPLLSRGRGAGDAAQCAVIRDCHLDTTRERGGGLYLFRVQEGERMGDRGAD